MVRLTDEWSPAPKLAYTTACISLLFCASLISASVSARLGKGSGARCCKRAAPKPLSLASHWRVSCLVESQNLYLIPRAFWPFSRRQKPLVTRLVEPLCGRAELPVFGSRGTLQDWALVQRQFAALRVSCCCGTMMPDNLSRNLAKWRRIYILVALP